MELWSALLGAVVGGLIAGVVAWLQTRASLRHELSLFREGVEADRQAGRAALRRVAATDALTAIAAVDAAMPHMDHRFVRTRTDSPTYLLERRDRAERAMTELRRVEVSSIPVLGAELQEAWSLLRRAASDAARAGEVMGDDAFRAAADALAERVEAMHAVLVEVALAD